MLGITHTDYKIESIGAVIIVCFVLSIIIGLSIIWKSKRKLKKEEGELIYKRKNCVNFMMKGSLSIKNIRVEEIGKITDFLLTKENAINQILIKQHMRSVTCNEFNVLSVLVFSDVIIPHMNREDCSQMIELIQMISKLNTRIDFVLTGNMEILEFVDYMITNNMRYDTLYDSTDSIVISKLCEYDMVLHPYSGLNSGYEIITGVLDKLSSGDELHTNDTQTKNDVG